MPEGSADYVRNMRKMVEYTQLGITNYFLICRFIHLQENRYHIMKEEENKKQVTWHPNMGRLYMVLCILLIGMEFASLYAVYNLNVWQNKEKDFLDSWKIPRDYYCTVGADKTHNSCTVSLVLLDLINYI